MHQKMPNVNTSSGESDPRCWVGVGVKQPEGDYAGFSPPDTGVKIDLSSSWLRCITFAVRSGTVLSWSSGTLQMWVILQHLVGIIWLEGFSLCLYVKTLKA